MISGKKKRVEDDDPVILISKEYVQEFAEANFNRILTKEQLQLVSDALCGWAITNAMDHMEDAIHSAIEFAVEENNNQ